jgi:diketogulonate reductase-like aldo/keto reductase
MGSLRLDGVSPSWQFGLILTAISLGLWQLRRNRPFDVQREVLRHAFDKGITHFDPANNYGPPHGPGEENFGRMMRSTASTQPASQTLPTTQTALLKPPNDRTDRR